MQYTTILALAFATSISALPTTSNVVLRISNDQTGTSSDSLAIAADNVARPVKELFAGTAIANAGFVATSAQLTQFTDSTKCALVDVVHNWRVELDGRAKNFVDLDGDVTRPVPVWVGDLSLQCTN